MGRRRPFAGTAPLIHRPDWNRAMRHGCRTRGAAHPQTRYCPPAAYRCVVVARQAPMGCRGLFVAAVFGCRNKNLDAIATFLRLGTPFRLCKAETGYHAVAHLRFCAADLRPGTLRQSLIAKKLQSRPVFCFCAFGTGPRWRGTGARGVGDA